MDLSEEMKKMIDVVKQYDFALKRNRYKSYIAPDIPDKIIKKLLKNFDSHMPINSIVAYYDDTAFETTTRGTVFTSDGVYFKDIICKPVYFQYSDIIECEITDKGLRLHLQNCVDSYYENIAALDVPTKKIVIEQLKKIDFEYGQTTFKSSGKIKKIDIPKDMLVKCNGFIHSASVACGGVGTGLAQIPASDNAVIVPIQIGMIVGLGTVFDLNITEAEAKSIIASASATIAGRTITQFLVGWIPGIGNAINTATAAGLTEAIGWIAVKNFYDRWIQDKNKGRLEGMKDGYTEASGEYERKLRKQAEEFFNQMKDVQEERDEYERLLNEYEKYIKELEIKCAASELIQETEKIYQNLRKLKSA